MGDFDNNIANESARNKFLALSLESTRKSYYPQLLKQLDIARKNEERLQLLFDKLPARISFIDNRERFVFINLEYEAGYDLKREQIIGQQVETIVGPDHYIIIKDYLAQALSGKQVHFEAPFTTSDGKSQWHDISYVPETDAKGDVVGFYTLSIDRTEKKQMEQEKASLELRLHQAQKMEAIGTLAGGIAHDFNNILSGIFGYSQLAETNINNPERAIQYIQKIFKGAQRASSLIQQILAFSRHSDDNRQPMNMAVQLKEAIKMLRSTIPANIEIKEKIVSRAKILADTTQIHQVIMNLCTNAYHAMGDNGGILTVGLEEVEIAKKDFQKNSNKVPGKFLRLEVSDTGSGIETKIQDRIFEPYFTTKGIGKGTGLGLAMVDGIIKKHNGFIRLDSNPEKGTTFYIYLPILDGDNFLEPHKNIDIKLSQGIEKIMVVDDEEDIRETVKGILELQGYHVAVFENGKQALEMFTQDPYLFDLVITDMTMPQITGDKLSKQILKIRKNIPIVLCTGYHESLTKEAALEMGIKVYIEKPVSGMELSKIIRGLLDESAT